MPPRVEGGDRARSSVDLRVPAPADGGPLLDGEVREEEGDDPVVCVTNVPVLGTRCVVNDDGLVLP